MVRLSSFGAKTVFVNRPENTRGQIISKRRGIFIVVQNIPDKTEVSNIFINYLEGEVLAFLVFVWNLGFMI